ncbi:MAG: hypothetical protein E6J19_06700 [Chloroflexi bacterium]|nr:MAG: hypothetical protein E6J27_13955 [Chloroflexota bacterium]TMC57202.1 MAG: hypothetical protein E6J19_06700 [Chloroflexota bacterium]
MTMEAPLGSTAEAPQLRPLGVGDIIDRVLRMYRQRPVLFLTLSAIPNLIGVLIAQGARLVWPNAFLDFDQFAFLNDPNRMLAQLQAQQGRSGDTIVGLVSVIPQSLGIAALTYAAANMYLGRPVAIGAAFRAALADVPRLILTLFVLVIVLFGIWFAAIFVSTLPAVISGIGILIILVFFAVAVLPFFLLASFALVPTVSALEDAGPIHSMRRSLQLIAGSRWRIIGLLVLLLVLEIVLGVVLSTVFLGAFLTQSTAGRVAAVLVGAAGTIAWEPLPWATLALFYYDMRVRKEALDLQLAAEALPRTE